MTRRLISPTLIGRDAELAALRAAVDGREGESRPVVFVLGDAGAGKTRLLDELRRSLDGGDRRCRTVFALGHCLLGVAGALPSAAVLELLDDLKEAAEGQSVLRAIDAARRLLVDAPDVTSGSGSADGGEANRIRRLEAVLTAVRAVAQGRPAVLAIDDVQWADAATIDLVAFLARRLARSRILLLLAYREREARLRPEIARCLAELEAGWLRDRVPVTSLGHRDALELVDAIAGARITREQAARIADRAGGNPLFLEQLVAAEAERQAEREAEREARPEAEREMGQEADADAAVRTLPSEPDPLRPAGADPWHLSDRERQVLALVGAGRTNREIGDALFITDKTASSHVTHILDKLGVDTRVKAALAAAGAGLVPVPDADQHSGPTGDAFQASPDDAPPGDG